MKSKDVIICGTKGFAKEAYYLIQKKNENDQNLKYNILGFMSSDKRDIGQVVCDNCKVIVSDDTISNFLKSKDETVAFILSIGDTQTRKNIYLKLKDFPNAIFPNFIHPTACFESEEKIGFGNIITAGTIFACNVSIGNCNLVNLNTTIGHDDIIGNFNTINPNCSVSGNVKIGDECLIGTGAIVLQNLTIGSGCTIGAGAVVTKDVLPKITMVGVPAKQMKKEKIL